MSANLDEMYADLEAADKLGDNELAQSIAAKIREAEKPSIAQQVVKGLEYTNPFSLAAKGSQAIAEQVTKAAYDAGGAVTDALARDRTGAPGSAWKPENAALAGWAANTAVEAIPVIAGQATGKLASPAFVGKAKDLMQSALKPTLQQQRSGQAAKAIDTMLDEGVNVSKGGLEKLRGKIDVLDDEIETAIKGSSATVSNPAVANRLRDTFNRFKNQVTPDADLETIRKAWSEFRAAHPQTIPVQQAQELKRGTYKSLGSKSFGELKGAEIEAQKDLARGLKEEIAAAVPSVGPANAQQSKLLNASEVLERRLMTSGNRDVAGVTMLAENPKAWALMMADRSPLIKSAIARLLYSGSEVVPGVLGGTAGGILGGYSGYRSE